MSLTLKYGLAENWDAGLKIPYKLIDFAQSGKVDGVGDVNILTKYRFLEGSGGLPAFALGLNLKIKTGDEDKSLGSGQTDYGLNGILTMGIEAFTLHLNLGYTCIGEPGDADDVFSYGLALEYPLRKDLNLVGEVAGETTFDGLLDDNPCSGLFGLNYALGEMITLDFGGGFEISEASPDYTITTGMTLGF